MASKKPIDISPEFVNIGSEYTPLLVNKSLLAQAIQIEEFTYNCTRVTFTDGREIYLKMDVKAVHQAICPPEEVEEEVEEETDEAA